MIGRALLAVLIFTSIAMTNTAMAAIESSITGQALDSDQAAVSGANVDLLDAQGHHLKDTKTDMMGAFSFFPVELGSYKLLIKKDGYASQQASASVTSSAPTTVSVLLTATQTKEIVINVKEKRNLIPSHSSGSQRELSKEDIESRPQGDQISLPKLLAETTPGIVQGPFGQMYIRGNHANIQYQIDGVQLPDSTSGTFGDAFSPRNIDHMETITGGIPAEYGERMAAVVNIVTKSGPEKPGGNVDVMYGSYNTISPQATLGGSDSSGHIHYFGSFNYMQTDRGLDTPEPKNYSDQRHGGSDAIHDHAHSHEEFVRLDDIVGNNDKLTVTAFNSNRFYQIPVYPSSFKPTDSFFQAGYTDSFGNQADDPTKTTYNYVPSNTNDTQTEQNTYIEFVWKHTISDSSFLQVAPYFKYSSLKVTNDPTNDLATTASGATPITGSQATSFALDRYTNNAGLKTDYTWRANDQNLVKAGFQAQNSYSRSRNLTIQTELNTAPFVDDGSDTGNLEAIYLQDSYVPFKKFTVNLGVRATATQFKSDDVNTHDGLAQPRLGLEYFVTPTTKLHAFYGKLFQPAPFENLRKAFTSVGGGQLTPYDVKAEKDDYYEGGVTQQLGARQVATLTYYYKKAKDMMDDAQLLNTSMAQPYNFAEGYATGLEFSVSGDIIPHLSEFFNYSYEDARGKGLSGGIFAFNPGTYPANEYQFLDHVQLNTANLGFTYHQEKYWATLQGLYGSGLRTGANNGLSLPSHTTFDITLGYKLKTSNWTDGLKASFDVLNITDDAYPITIANGFNGSHYSAGREFFFHLGKEF